MMIQLHIFQTRYHELRIQTNDGFQKDIIPELTFQPEQKQFNNYGAIFTDFNHML